MAQQLRREEAAVTVRLTWDQVRAWRLTRQLLVPAPDPGVGLKRAEGVDDDVEDVVRVAARLCGVQAQVSSAAKLAIAIRQRRPQPGQIAQALSERRLLLVWAMRGTLHLLPSADAVAFLALLAATRSWEKPVWQRDFLTADRLAAVADAVADALDGRVLTREQLAAEVVARTGNASLSEALNSGWGAVLKPLAWQGLLCHSPADGNRVTFTRPDTWLPGWRIPDVDDGARTAVPTYLAAYGPAAPAAFDTWLTRGTTRKSTLRGWFDDLGDQLTLVDVEGATLYARTLDIKALAAARPAHVVRLLPGFDQHILGPGTGDPHTVPRAHRTRVSRTAGWIAPTVVTGDGVVGTWAIDRDQMQVDLFPDAPPPDPGLAHGRSRPTRTPHPDRPETFRRTEHLTRAGRPRNRIPGTCVLRDRCSPPPAQSRTRNA